LRGTAGARGLHLPVQGPGAGSGGGPVEKFLLADADRGLAQPDAVAATGLVDLDAPVGGCLPALLSGHGGDLRFSLAPYTGGFWSVVVLVRAGVGLGAGLVLSSGLLGSRTTPTATRGRVADLLEFSSGPPTGQGSAVCLPHLLFSVSSARLCGLNLRIDGGDPIQGFTDPTDELGFGLEVPQS